MDFAKLIMIFMTINNSDYGILSSSLIFLLQNIILQTYWYAM